MIWIDDWEKCVIGGKITNEEFLTKTTVEGIRVSISSTIDLTQYLLNECEFKYVLSNKMNQVRIEVC